MFKVGDLVEVIEAVGVPDFSGKIQFSVSPGETFQVEKVMNAAFTDDIWLEVVEHYEKPDVARTFWVKPELVRPALETCF